MVSRTQLDTPGMAFQADSREARGSIFINDISPPAGGEITFVDTFIEGSSLCRDLALVSDFAFSNDCSLPEREEQTCMRGFINDSSSPTGEKTDMCECREGILLRRSGILSKLRFLRELRLHCFLRLHGCWLGAA